MPSTTGKLLTLALPGIEPETPITLLDLILDWESIETMGGGGFPLPPSLYRSERCGIQSSASDRTLLDLILDWESKPLSLGGDCTQTRDVGG